MVIMICVRWISVSVFISPQNKEAKGDSLDYKVEL